MKEAFKKIAIRIVMCIFIIMVMMLLLNKTKIIRWYLERDMSEFDKVFIVLTRDAGNGNIEESFRKYKNSGLIKATFMDENFSGAFTDEMKREIFDNCSSEDYDYFEQLLYGGFEADKYFSDHSFEDFYLLVTRLDVLWPEGEIQSRDGLDYLYDEDGNAIMEPIRYTFWSQFTYYYHSPY